MLNLDTHMVLYAMTGDLRPRERELLSSDSWAVAAIVPWELAKLVQLKRITLDFDESGVVDMLSQIHVLPLDLAIARASTRLDFRGDPADELIAATSVVHRIPLVTRDRRMRRSNVVPIAR